MGVPETGRASGKRFLASETVVDESVDEGVSGLRGAAVMFGELSADEDTGVEADEGEPGGLIGRKAEGAERGVATVQVGHVGRRGWHVRSRAVNAPARRRCGVVRVPNSWCVSPPPARPDGAGEESSGEGGLKSAWRRPGSSGSEKLGKWPSSIRARRDWEEIPEHPLLLMSRPSGKRQCRTWRHSCEVRQGVEALGERIRDFLDESAS